MKLRDPADDLLVRSAHSWDVIADRFEESGQDLAAGWLRDGSLLPSWAVRLAEEELADFAPTMAEVLQNFWEAHAVWHVDQGWDPDAEKQVMLELQRRFSKNTGAPLDDLSWSWEHDREQLNVTRVTFSWKLVGELYVDVGLLMRYATRRVVVRRYGIHDQKSEDQQQGVTLVRDAGNEIQRVTHIETTRTGRRRRLFQLEGSTDVGEIYEHAGHSMRGTALLDGGLGELQELQAVRDAATRRQASAYLEGFANPRLGEPYRMIHSPPSGT